MKHAYSFFVLSSFNLFSVKLAIFKPIDTNLQPEVTPGFKMKKFMIQIKTFHQIFMSI